MSAFDWQVDGHYIGTKIGGRIQIIKCRATNMIAYFIPNKHVMNDEVPFVGEYEHLKNNYGIYFLLGDEDKNDGKRGIYIGQASERNNSKGMSRLKEHLNSKTEPYRNNWDCALFITTTDNSWSTGMIDTLECIFIHAYMNNDEYACLNGKKGKLGNIPDESFNTELIAIGNLLEDKFGLVVSAVSKQNIETSMHKLMLQMANELRIELEEERKEYRQKFSEEYIESIDWVAKVKTYKQFKSSIEQADLLKSGGRVLGGSKGEVYTEAEVVSDVMGLVPNSKYKSTTKFFEMACKSGSFIIYTINKLMSDDPELPINHEDKFKDKLVRLKHIIENQIYGVCLSENGYLLACHEIIKLIEEYEYKLTGERSIWSRSALDSISTIPNIHYIDGYAKMVQNSPKELVKLLREKFSKAEDDGDVKFDIVIGNPPYNNDMYLDFVWLGHNLAQDCCVMITPAKWQAKTDGKPKGSKTVDKNEAFREKIVPYMSKVVHYKDSTEVFKIQEWGGICYYLIDKEKHLIKLVKNVCSKNASLESDWEEHDETKLTLVNRKILNIIGKVGTLGEGFKQSLYVKNTDHGEISIDGTLGFKRFTFTAEQERGENKPQGPIKGIDYVDVMQGEKLVGYKAVKDLFTTMELTKYKCISSIMPGAVAAFDNNNQVLGMFKISVIGPNQVPKGSFPVLHYFDTYEESVNFVRYMECRLIAFLYYLGTCGTTLTKEFFRYVPDPNEWSIIYEDEPLPGYETDKNGIYIDNEGKKHCALLIKYGISKEEKELIYSIVKERKPKDTEASTNLEDSDEEK